MALLRVKRYFFTRLIVDIKYDMVNILPDKENKNKGEKQMKEDALSDLHDVGDLTAQLNERRIYLSDVLDETVFKKGQANIIVAPCHSGKTTAAIAKLSRLASFPEKMLFLIDTTAGKEALLRRDAQPAQIQGY
jgi:hypothetical protein